MKEDPNQITIPDEAFAAAVDAMTPPPEPAKAGDFVWVKLESGMVPGFVHEYHGMLFVDTIDQVSCRSTVHRLNEVQTMPLTPPEFPA